MLIKKQSVCGVILSKKRSGFAMPHTSQPRFTSHFVGALGGTRTRDPLIRSQVLYPAELRAQTIKF